MTANIQVGSVLLHGREFAGRTLGLESESYSGGWNLLHALDGFGLDRKLRSSGWNSFFLAAEVQATVLGRMHSATILSALKRILKKVSGQDFNGLEVTGISSGSMLGLQYVTVSAHSRHIQRGWLLDQARERRASATQVAE
jgi:hypothetical protein